MVRPDAAQERETRMSLMVLSLAAPCENTAHHTGPLWGAPASVTRKEGWERQWSSPFIMVSTERKGCGIVPGVGLANLDNSADAKAKGLTLVVWDLAPGRFGQVHSGLECERG